MSSSMLLNLYQLALCKGGGACICAFASFCGVNATSTPNFKLLASPEGRNEPNCPSEPVWTDLSTALRIPSAREKNEQEKTGRFSNCKLKENGQRNLHPEGTIWVRNGRTWERELCTQILEKTVLGRKNHKYKILKQELGSAERLPQSEKFRWLKAGCTRLQ